MAKANEKSGRIGKATTALPLSCLNHISRACSNLKKAEHFYENLLGFQRIKRPRSFDFDGAWLYNYGIGVHLLECESRSVAQEKEIDPKSDHISFQCEDIGMVETTLIANGINYLRQQVEEGGILVDQLFFHDPDGFMIEVCNCDQIPVVPLPQSASMSKERPLFPSCKRTSSWSATNSLAIPDRASQNPLQDGTQMGHADYAICG